MTARFAYTYQRNAVATVDGRDYHFDGLWVVYDSLPDVGNWRPPAQFFTEVAARLWCEREEATQ